MKKTIADQRGIAMVFELLLVAVVLGLVGLAIYASGQHKTSPIAGKTSPKASPTVSASPTPNSYAGWKTYTSSFEKLSFKYPASWSSVAPLQSNVPGADSFAVQSPNGLKVSWIAAADGLGGACDTTTMPGATVAPDELGPCPYWTVTDTQKLTGANLYYVDGVVTSDGSTYRPWCALQASGGMVKSQSSIGYLMFSGKNNDYINASGQHFPESAALLCGSPFNSQGTPTGTKAQAEALLLSPDYQTARQILTSASY